MLVHKFISGSVTTRSSKVIAWLESARLVRVELMQEVLLDYFFRELVIVYADTEL